MSIKLSPKYKPLFKLLRNRPLLEQLSLKGLSESEVEQFRRLELLIVECNNITEPTNEDKELLNSYRLLINDIRFLWLDETELVKINEALILDKVDTVLCYGGRDSGKTFSESVIVPIAVKDFNHRILYTRYTMNSTDQSISQALNDRIGDLNCVDSFSYANNTYRCLDNAGKINITGHKTSSKTQTAKLKSLEDYSMFITDEGDEIPCFEDWDKIRKSIRAQDLQCINMIVFNPPTKEHWIFEEFFEDMGVDQCFNGIKDNVMYIHTTYKDNYEFLADHNKRDYAKLKANYEIYIGTEADKRDDLPAKVKKDARKYKNVGLGMFADNAEGVIYEDYKLGEFNDALPFVHGLDFGFADPDALVKVAVDHGRQLAYLKQIYYRNSTGMEELAKVLIELVGHSGLILGDNAEKRLISDLWHKGINIEKCSKGNVKRRIKMVQGYTLVVDPSSLDIIKSINNYVWKNSAAGLVEHKWSHLPHAWEYAMMELCEY